MSARLICGSQPRPPIIKQHSLDIWRSYLIRVFILSSSINYTVYRFFVAELCLTMVSRCTWKPIFPWMPSCSLIFLPISMLACCFEVSAVHTPVTQYIGRCYITGINIYLLLVSISCRKISTDFHWDTDTTIHLPVQALNFILEVVVGAIHWVTFKTFK